MELATVLSVLLAFANFIVLVKSLDPVASCVIITVALEPATAFANALNVKLLLAVYAKIVPDATSGVIEVLVLVLPTVVSLNFVNLTLANTEFPVADTKPAVNKLPPVMLAVADTSPAVNILP